MISRRKSDRRPRPNWPVPRKGLAAGGLVAAVTLSAAALGACGGDSDEGSGVKPAPKRPAQVVKLRVHQSVGRIVYDKSRLRVRPGTVAIELSNPSPVPHNVRIATGSKCCRRTGSKDIGGTNTIDPGRKTRAVVNLPPGRYVFFCAVSGHWQQGQHGTLVVR